MGARRNATGGGIYSVPVHLRFIEVLNVERVIDINTFFGPSDRAGVKWTLDDLLALVERYQVERALTLSLRGVYYDFVAGNTETMQVCRRHPELVPVATVDPRRYIECIDEVRRCVDEGIRAFRFFPDVQGWPLEHAHFLRVCEQIADAGAAIMLPGAAAGAPSAAARLLGDLGTPVVVLGVSYATLAELLGAMEASEDIYCEGHMFDTPWAYELVRDVAGPQRAMLGSGMPERYFASAYLMVKYAELSDEEREAVLYSNAARVLLGEEA